MNFDGFFFSLRFVLFRLLPKTKTKIFHFETRNLEMQSKMKHIFCLGLEPAFILVKPGLFFRLQSHHSPRAI